MIQIQGINPQQAHAAIMAHVWPWVKAQTSAGHAVVLEARLHEDVCYHLHVNANKVLIGCGSPLNRCDASRSSLAESCGFVVCAPIFGGSDGRPEMACRFAQAVPGLPPRSSRRPHVVVGASVSENRTALAQIMDKSQISTISNDVVKTCTCCKQVKPITEYHKDKQKKSGLYSICKECNRKKAIAWANENLEKNRARTAKWKKENPDRAKKTADDWRENNPERKKKNDSDWRKANPELCRLHGLNRRARVANAGGSLSKGLAERLFKLQNGKCPCCKKPLGADYHLDHIIPLVSGGKNVDANMQLLRKTCNLQKNRKDPVLFMQERGFLL